jgi:predicted transcriptional regulator YheO
VSEKQDLAFLETYKPLMEAIGSIYGLHCEVVLHYLPDLSHSVIHIVNGHVTGRKVGSPMTDLGVKQIKNINKLESDTIGPYISKLDDGRILRCTTTILRNPAGKPVGTLCINMDLSAPLLDFLKDFNLKVDSEAVDSIEHFAFTPEELIIRALDLARQFVNRQKKLSPSERNKQIIFELIKKGIFSVKGAVDIVARESGISRYTVYNYMREAKNKQE